MSVWWCAYNVPDFAAGWYDLPDWIWFGGGVSEDCVRWYARVEAPTAAAAERLIRSQYDRRDRQWIEVHTPQLREDGWWPDPTRYPRREGTPRT